MQESNWNERGKELVEQETSNNMLPWLVLWEAYRHSIHYNSIEETVHRLNAKIVDICKASFSLWLTGVWCLEVESDGWTREWVWISREVYRGTPRVRIRP